MNMQQDYKISYGMKCNAEELETLLEHLIQNNERLMAEKHKKYALCVWGEHGIGKTAIVENFAQKHGYDFVYISPAQFEEMGDLIGMPKIVEQEEGNFATQLVPPEWIPKANTKGILLIDDVNRADDRILRGIMQLLQRHELVSWKLPPSWHIILTANPEGGDYSITQMDYAMLTRILHITLTFDLRTWLRWAEKNQIDGRGITFVMSYPEVIQGLRTNPRTLVQFFENIQYIPNLQKELPLVQLLAEACLDTPVSQAFIAFVKQDLQVIISPQDIIQATDFQAQIYEPLQKVAQTKDGIKRVDILAIITTRLVSFLTTQHRKWTKGEIENIRSFFKMDTIPADLRLIAAKELSAAVQYNKYLEKIIAEDAQLSKLLLQW